MLFIFFIVQALTYLTFSKHKHKLNIIVEIHLPCSKNLLLFLSHFFIFCILEVFSKLGVKFSPISCILFLHQIDSKVKHLWLGKNIIKNNFGGCNLSR